jgi:hypothetical protein
MGVDPTDYVGHKRFLALFSGGMLPLISLSFLHMLVKFTEEDRNKEIKQEESKPEDLKEFVDESTRIRLTEKDLKILEETLLNPPAPNDKLKEAAKEYKEKIDKETQRELLTQIMEKDQELGLYDEPVNDQTINEEPTFENQEVEKPIENEKTQLQKLEDYVNPSTPPQNDNELVLTTNNDIIEPIPSDDEISDWDETLTDGLEEEIFQEEPTIEEEVQNFSTIENETVNIFQEEVNPEFEIPEQEGWTEEIEQTPEPIVVPTEIYIQPIEEPQPEQVITIGEDMFKPLEVDSVTQDIKEQEEEQVGPSFEVIAEKKNL